jgi:hypothetical protein
MSLHVRQVGTFSIRIFIPHRAPGRGDGDERAPARLIRGSPLSPWRGIRGIESLMVGTGTSAVAFASNVPDFGPTQDLWLTHDGYLFEIVTYPDLGPWLAQIINTIQFP